MKSKTKLVSFIVAVFLGFQIKAQTICDNLLNCDVTIFYEMFDQAAAPGSPCVSSCSGTFMIPAGGTGYILPDCTSSDNHCDVCIIITDIGGWTPPLNHSSANVGHVMTPYGQTGSLGAGACSTGSLFTATQMLGSWVIQ